MNLWQTVLVVVYMAGAWTTVKQGFERNADVSAKRIMGYPVHPFTMLYHKVFYANTFQIILTALLWPVSMLLGIGILLFKMRELKRLAAAASLDKHRK